MSTKDTVLALFEKNKGFYVSGEKIASDLNISRTAVWKAVKKLQSEGYEIKAVTNRGYCLDKESDVLTAHGIRSFLGDEYPCLKPEVFVTVDSTNNVCRAKAEEGKEEGYVAVAGAQTSGRGRRGRSFYSPAGSGIYMSILLRPEDFSEKQVLQLTTMAAVAVSVSVEKISGKTAGIKWVNDILIDGKKVCGILSEASYKDVGDLDYVIVGIGINAYPPAGGFPAGIADIAASVFDYPSPGLKNELAAEVMKNFMAYYTSGTGCIEEYRKHCIVPGKDITVIKPGEKLNAHAIGLDDDCGLIVRYPDGSEETLRSGEISIRL
jgi:BirA family biotin operon repressor/biotin-[acetyl-CoA-carboxylase] ligase